MHLRNCFAQRFESDSAVSGFYMLVSHRTWRLRNDSRNKRAQSFCTSVTRRPVR